MSKLMVYVDYQKCRPEQCPDGKCPAIKECEKRILKQDIPYDYPYRLSEMCLACGTCVSACPLEALRLG